MASSLLSRAIILEYFSGNIYGIRIKHFKLAFHIYIKMNLSKDARLSIDYVQMASNGIGHIILLVTSSYQN